MCTIQQTIFNKNGDSEFDCNNVQLSDKITVAAVVSFDASEVGRTVVVIANVKFPDGIERGKYTIKYISSPETYDFSLPVDLNIAGVGTYSFISLEVWDYYTDERFC